MPARKSFIYTLKKLTTNFLKKIKEICAHLHKICYTETRVYIKI